MKNKLIDLNNHLFAQLERLNDEEITGDALSEEVQRSKAICNVGLTIVSNAKLALRAEEMRAEYGDCSSMPWMLQSGRPEEGDD